ncbi:hypothetical protein FKR81_15280 [Lentzea tibetensis]|uniref:Uncharacterized protein n=1 Tax=Lentzea tibetensis TaxID=2591470 RepID=A0A563EV40_9PSEU|nr:hypothetical protein [Lentzea tibetensis]TWP51555.1 hypothetical protein FKR81_15280 [Lentzea tibetensis]
MRDSPWAISRFDEALLELLGQGQKHLSLADAVDAIGIESGEQINVETILAESNSPLESLLPRALSGTEKDRRGVQHLEIVDNRGSFVISAWPTAHRGVFHLAATTPFTDPRWQKVERWIGRANPEVVPCFLNHADFIDIGRALSEIGDAEVSRLTARNLVDQSSLGRSWKSRSDGLRLSPLEAIAEVEANHASVRTMTMRVGQLLSLHLRRLAGATFYSGNFTAFDDVVLSRLAKAGATRRSLMANRHRRVGKPVGTPISVKLPGAFLGTEIDTSEVLETLEELSQVSVAVLHRNPYLHVVVTDYSDGSNFDLFVTDADSIDIYPGFRASRGSLTRLSQRLGERFLATDISDAAEDDEVSLDDLVASR